MPNGKIRSKTPKGKEDALKVMAPQSKHYKQKAKKDSFFQKNGQTAIQNKKMIKMIKTYMHKDRYSKTVSKTWGGGG